MKINYSDYTVPFYSAPLLSSYGINLLINGQTKLGIFNLPTEGVQARLIGLIFLVFPILLIYYLFIQIPRSIGKGKIREIACRFLKSAFLFTWICCIVIEILSDYFEYGTVLFFAILVICFLFQKDFNEELIEIYNK